MPHETKHWIALSLSLPEYVHLETITGVRVDEEFLANHGFGPETYDVRWMQLPFSVQVGWKRVERPVHRAVELAFVAAGLSTNSFVTNARGRLPMPLLQFRKLPPSLCAFFRCSTLTRRSNRWRGCLMS